MAWKIRKELKKHLPYIKFNVKNWGNDWYEIIIQCPAKTIEDAKKALGIKDMVCKEMGKI